MVKQKAQKSWLQKTKSQRHAKSLTDARLLLKPLRNKTNYSEYVCCICNTKGALLACFKCLKLFHLACIDLGPLKIPLSQWPCSECAFEYNESFVEALADAIDGQKQEKDSCLKRLLKKINKAKPNNKIKDFEAKYPHLVKHGQVVYPIEDTLLWSKPKLHQISFVSFPNEHFFNVPSGIVSDLIFVCDFCHTFQGILATPDLKCESLYTILNSTYETETSRALLTSLLKPLVVIMLKSENFRKKGPVLNYLVYKIKKLVGFDRLLTYSYLKFVEDIFSIDLWKELIEDFDKEMWQVFNGFLFVEKYEALPAEYKLRLLVLFIGILLETKLINDECQRRYEFAQKLNKDLYDLSIKSRKSSNPDKLDFDQKSLELSLELQKYPVRSTPIGSDRHHREYFHYPWDSSKLFIKSPEPSHSNSFTWSYLDKRAEIEQLLQSLEAKGQRESCLIQSLSHTLSDNFRSSEQESTASGTDEVKTEHKETVNNLESLKNSIKNLHFTLVDALKLPVHKEFIQKVENCETSSIIELLLNFHLFSLNDKNLLWESCDLHLAWESALKECKNVDEVFICFHLLGLVTEKYAKEHRVVVKDKERIENRRSFRLERINKMKKEVQKAQDINCFICGDFGLVACCDRCPKVAHLECLGVEELPEGDWSCPVCVEKFNSVRVTRSKNLKF